MTRTSVALVLTLSATSAFAQDYNRQDLVRGLCQKDGCDEFTILAADRLKTSDEGTLFKTRLKTFHASHAGRQDRGEENGYVFCSPTRPAIMAEQNGQTMAFFLAPFATQESRESLRQNANFHALYFAICHGREAGKAAVPNLAGVAQSQGYRVTLAHSKLVPLKQAEDVITMDPDERAPVQLRHDERQERTAIEARREERLERLPVEPRALGRELPVRLRAWDGSETGPAGTPCVVLRSRRALRHILWSPGELSGGSVQLRRRCATTHRFATEGQQAPANFVESEGVLAGARRLTNRAFDTLDELGDWMIGRER